MDGNPELLFIKFNNRKLLILSHNPPAVPTPPLFLGLNLLTNVSGQPVQKEGDSREDVDIQYGDSEITIRLKEDQLPTKQGEIISLFIITIIRL